MSYRNYDNTVSHSRLPIDFNGQTTPYDNGLEYDDDDNRSTVYQSNTQFSCPLSKTCVCVDGEREKNGITMIISICVRVVTVVLFFN